MSIHGRIKALREAKGWSQQQLANEVSRREGGRRPLTWQAVQQWENEKSAPKRERLQHVADALGTTVSALVSGDCPAAPTPASHIVAEPPSTYGEMLPLREDEATLLAAWRLLKRETQVDLLATMEQSILTTQNDTSQTLERMRLLRRASDERIGSALPPAPKPAGMDTSRRPPAQREQLLGGRSKFGELSDEPAAFPKRGAK